MVFTKSTDSLFQHNDSFHLFLGPFHEAYDALVARGAAPLHQDLPDKGRQRAAGRAQQDSDSFDLKAQFNSDLPHISFIWFLDSLHIDNTLSRTALQA